MAYRKRIKMTKLPLFREALDGSCDLAKSNLGRELTKREVNYIKRYIYSIRKKMMKGYHSITNQLQD